LPADVLQAPLGHTPPADQPPDLKDEMVDDLPDNDPGDQPEIIIPGDLQSTGAAESGSESESLPALPADSSFEDEFGSPMETPGLTTPGVLDRSRFHLGTTLGSSGPNDGLDRTIVPVPMTDNRSIGGHELSTSPRARPDIQPRRSSRRTVLQQYEMLKRAGPFKGLQRK
ncbi:MAG: hypothetical protein AAGJ80_08595, partial [Cyanobacteria bacterium J06553_1]